MNILNEINIDINIRQRILDIIIFKRDPKYFFVFKSDFSALSDAGTFYNQNLKQLKYSVWLSLKKRAHAVSLFVKTENFYVISGKNL